MSGSAKDNNPADGPLRASACRRWSDEGSLLTGRSTAAQVKALLNLDYTLHAMVNTLADHIAQLEAEIELRKQISEASANQPDIPFTRLSALAIINIFLMFLVDLVSSGYDDPSAVVFWFSVLMLLFYFICIYLRWPVELENSSEIGKLRNFESLLVETLGHRQLEILCRYGDYLAERLNTLRQYVGEHGLEVNYQLSEKWTETSAILRAEEGKPDTPCHDLILTAAQGLNWNHKVIVFMAHEYGKRNSLMHAELFDLVDTKDWNSIGQRCEEDIKKLRELFIDSDSHSKAAIENWELIIGGFRDRWVRLSEDGSTWEAHLIIQEAIADGVDDSASLSKLSMRYKDAVYLDRDKAIKGIKKEKEQSDKQQKASKKLADAVLQNQNNLLQAELEKLRTLLEQGGVSGDVLKDLGIEVEKNDVLKKKNKTYENRIKNLEDKLKGLEDDRGKGLTRQRTIDALERLLKDVGFETTEKTTTEAKGKQTTSRKDRDTKKEHPTI